MAVHNEILVGRYNRFLQKLFGMKGSAPSPQLSSEVFPFFQLFGGVENRYLEQWSRWGFIANQAAVAANQSGVRFRNPAGSNVIAVFEKLLVWQSTAGDTPLVSLGTATADLGTIVAVFGTLDSREQRSAGSLAVSKQASAVSVPLLTGDAGILQFATGITPPAAAIDLILLEDHQFALLPGSALQIKANQVNTTFTVSGWWRERFLEESERA